jgi:ribose transport system substrate-binding protein
MWLGAWSVFGALFLSACGGNNSSSSNTGNATTATSTTAAPATSAAGVGNAAAPAAKKIRLAYIAKGQQDVYWQSVKKGLDQAVKEANAAGQDVEVFWDAPLKDGDKDAQITLVENYIAQKVDGIILCPLDDKALVAPAAKAHNEGIPLVIVDSTLDYKETVAFVGTDNFKGGQLDGEELARELNDKGNVVMLRYNPGSASCAEREAGFLDAISKHPSLKILSSDNYAGVTEATALDNGSNLLTAYKGEVDGVFTPNESSTNGMLLALEHAGLAGKVKFVGFDGGTKNVAALQAGEINALVLQYPYQMGYQGVKVMLDHLAGKTVPDKVDTGATLVTKENFDSPAVKELRDHTVM